MLWISSLITLSGMTIVLRARRFDLATPLAMDDGEGATAVAGLGILLLFLGASLGLVSGTTTMLGN
jgi:hypothetical protein